MGHVDAMALIHGALAGLLATALGFAKNAQSVEEFQWRGLLLKLPLGMLVGVVAAYQKIPFQDAMTWAGAIGLVTALDSVVKAIVRRFAPNWLVLEPGPKPTGLTGGSSSIPPMMLLFALALPFMTGCFDSPPQVIQGHDAAALCVQRSTVNYNATVDGLTQALRAERKAHVDYAVQKSMDNVRLEAAKDGGKIDAEKAVKYIQEAYAARDKQVAEMDALILKYRQAAQAGEREALFALQLMGELKKYDAAGIDPAKTISEASSILVPALRAPELESK